jgi:hypothetical protein
MYPSLWHINEPDGDKPQAISCLAGCVGWLILIIGGICCWNYWTSKVKRKAIEEEKRRFENLNQHRPETWHMPEEWRKELDRRADEWRSLEEEFRKSKNLP